MTFGIWFPCLEPTNVIATNNETDIPPSNLLPASIKMKDSKNRHQWVGVMRTPFNAQNGHQSVNAIAIHHTRVIVAKLRAALVRSLNQLCAQIKMKAAMKCWKLGVLSDKV